MWTCFYSYNSIQTFCSGRLVCILKYIASNPPQLLMSRALQKRFVCREVSLVGGDIALPSSPLLAFPSIFSSPSSDPFQEALSPD